MVEILLSPGYGAGWSTWNDDDPKFQRWMLTYQPIIDEVKKSTRLILNDRAGTPNEEAYHPVILQFMKEAKELFGQDYVCVLGAGDLIVKDVSGPFKINEYDGSESIEYGYSDFVNYD